MITMWYQQECVVNDFMSTLSVDSYSWYKYINNIPCIVLYAYCPMSYIALCAYCHTWHKRVSASRITTDTMHVRTIRGRREYKLSSHNFSICFPA